MKKLTCKDIASMTDSQVREELTRDFLERNGNTFVRIRRSDRLGWEETLPKGECYSLKMLSPQNTEELLKSAYSHACDMITAMNTPYKVTINVSGNRSCTNSKVLYVASDMLEDESLTVGQRLDIFTGYTVHEGAHLLYTNFQLGCNKNGIVRFLSNVLEDEMIEIRLGEEKPGFANFICAAKYHAFGRYEKKLDTLKNNQGKKENGLESVVNAILSMVRFPKRLTDEIIAEYGRILLEIRQVITPYPANTHECERKAEEIYGILMKYFKTKSQEDNPQNQQNNQGVNSDSNDSQCKKDINAKSSENTQNKKDEQTDKSSSPSEEKNEDDENKKEQNSSSADDKSYSDEKKADSSQETSENKDNENEDGSENDGHEETADEDPELERKIRNQIENDFNKIKDALEEISRNPGQRQEPSRIAEGFLNNNKVLARECEGELKQGTKDGRVIFKTPENKNKYMASLRRVKKFIPAVNKALRNNGTEYKTSLKGLRSGLLDPGKIAEAFQGVQTVYMKDGKVTTDNMTVALLIDESGSMEGTKLEAAQDTAILFLEALKTVPNVNLHIYGYSREEFSLDLYNYAQPGSKTKYNLGSMIARGSTPTSKAIEETVEILKSSKDQKKLLIIVSDGMPDEGHQTVAMEVRKCEKRDIRVLGISIDDGLPESDLKMMYRNYIKFDNMNSLVSSLGKVLKKEVLANTTKRQNT